MCFRFFLSFFALVFSFLLEGQVVVDSPLAEKSSGTGGTLFEKIAPEKSGVNFSFDVNPEHPLKRLYAQGWAVGNVAIGDVNGDGKNDLFFAGAGTGRNRLFVQRGAMNFEEVTDEAAIAGSGWATCAVMGDVDGDGDLDVYVTRYRERNQLFINVSQGGVVRFEERAKDFNVDLVGGFMGASFVDLNRDGKVDLFLAGYHTEPESGRPVDLKLEKPEDLPAALKASHIVAKGKDGKLFFAEAGTFDAILMNTGQGRFEDASRQAGLGLSRNYTTSATWLDTDNDRLADLIVGADSHGPDLFFRQSQRGFQELSRLVLPVVPWMSRGSVAADFNNDLRVDFFGSGMGPVSHREKLAWGEPVRQDLARLLTSGGAMQVARNVLLANSGTRRFTEVGLMAGVAHSGASWAAKAGDFDCDGWMDLFVTTGEIRDRMAVSPASLEGENLKGKTRWDLLTEAGAGERREPDVAWRNLGDWRFENVTDAWGLGGPTMSYAAGMGDLDGDGDLDLVVCRANEPVAIYRNHAQGNRVVLELAGVTRFTTGVEVLIEAGGQQQMRQVYPSGGFRGSDPWELSIGLGTATKVDKLTVYWPQGLMTTLENLAVGKRYKIGAATTRVEPVRRVALTNRLFAESQALRGMGYAEQPFDERGGLLPRRMSHEGPSLAIMDLNGDGDAEVFVGGSVGRAGQLLARDEKLGVLVQPFKADAQCEDMGAVFFDADNDDDLDFFVGSGGQEYVAGHEAYRDRLYLNDGTGQFSKAPAGALPDIRESTSVVAAADFDGDGDLDLFVGCRATVGKFPESPGGFILQNDGTGKFSDVTKLVAPELAQAGMVISALWTDANGDGTLDLLITTDWGPIRFFKNEGGKLTEATEAAGLGNLKGLWRGIAGRDLDNDGDIDYVVTNAGLNTEMSASQKQPKRILWGDLAGVGGDVILETTIGNDGNIYPSRPYADWAEAVPSIAKTISDARTFANGGFGQIFTGERLANAKQLAVTTLESGVLINDGSGKFQFQPLPRIAQSSPGLGVVLSDFDLDGHCDCLILQNEGAADLLNPEPANKGLSIFLHGTGDATRLFDAVSPSESGFAVIGIGRSFGLVDLNGDGLPDVIGLRNGAEPATFITQGTALDLKRRQAIRAELGDRGRHFAGARVTLKVKGQPDQTAEYYAGGGYLSQSTPVLFFSAPKGVDTAVLEIRWPDGKVEERPLYF